MMLAALFWLALAIVCLAIEVHTNAFVAIFAGFAAAFTFALALTGISFLIQALAWIVVSVVTLALARPFALKRYQRRHAHNFAMPTESTMSDFLGTVEEAVGDAGHPGRVRLQGESWRAVTDWPEAIAVGQPVKVRRVLGTTLWVDPL
jgi:membrane protein implicated in regulation of membrane protease activity